MPFVKGGPPGPGRAKGKPNKATANIKALAQEYGEQAIKTLVTLMTRAKAEATRVAAAKELLDRAYGKSTQSIEAEMLHGMSEELRQFIAGNATASRAFVGFAEEDQDQKEALNGGSLPHHR